MSRIDKDKYYLDIAEVVLTRSTCMNKHWGAVLVKDDTIISTGFNGAPRGVKTAMKMVIVDFMNIAKNIILVEVKVMNNV